jgi:cytochrome c peroxidase
MSHTLLVMLLAMTAGVLALYLISGDLAARVRLAGPGRLLLAGGLGLGVIGISVKFLLVGYLSSTAGAYHPAGLADLDSTPIFPARTTFQSSYTGPWHALPEAAPTPDNAPLHPDVVRLGKRLFNDPRLSVDGSVSCSTCHKLSDGGDDNASVATGIENLKGTRNAPTVWNSAFLSRLFWDGRAGSLEEQAQGPLLNPVEMGMPSGASVEATVAADPAYRAAFRQTFGSSDAITFDKIAHAIASFERTLISPDTAYDRFVRGDTGALTQQQVRGMALFAGLGCRECHRDPTFSAAGKIRPGGVRKPFPVFADDPFVRKYDFLRDRGASRMETTGLWRVPSLRNVANTAPYFHNGSVKTLEEAIRVMAAVQLGRRIVLDSPATIQDVDWDPSNRRLTPLRPASLTERDVSALAAFLRSLSVPEAAIQRARQPADGLMPGPTATRP